MSKSSGKLSFSVVTCTYSPARTAQLRQLVESLRGQTVPADEVIVVVDQNPELLAELRDRLEGCVVTPNVHGRGLSGARNTGLETARFDVVAFIDDDAVPERDWLERLRDAYVDPVVIGVGGQVEPRWDGEVPPWFPAEFGWVVGCGYAGLPQVTTTVRNFIGCNMSFRREEIADAGGFRIDLGRIGIATVGCEETEFCIRLMRDRAGRVLRFEPAARVRHFVPRQRMSWRYFHSRCFFEGMSKARVARLVGADAALESERAYVVRALARGVVRNVGLALRGDLWALARAGAIVDGLSTTTFGYLAGRARLAFAREAAPPPKIEVVHQA
jgi:glycosyltransferase involved in cell wall biosynthesis